MLMCLIDRMRTFSGDVFKTKVYVIPEGSFDDFKVLAELPVESKELLVDLIPLVEVKEVVTSKTNQT